MSAVDLFAGPGGWDLAAKALGLEVVGVEIDASRLQTFDPADWEVNYRRGGDRIDEATPVDAPSPTVTSRFDRWQIKEKPDSTRELQADDWPFKRPATTIAGDPRVFQPGGHHTPGSQSENAIRVSVEQAGVLQSFPPRYPWRGTKQKQHEQVGNAVPPLLALAVLEVVAG